MATKVAISMPMGTETTTFEALKQAIRIAGSQAEIARVCGVSTTAVWKWVTFSKRVPAEFVLKVEARTGVSRHELRPDIYPIERRRARKAVA